MCFCSTAGMKRPPTNVAQKPSRQSALENRWKILKADSRRVAPFVSFHEHASYSTQILSRDDTHALNTVLCMKISERFSSAWTKPLSALDDCVISWLLSSVWFS